MRKITRSLLVGMAVAAAAGLLVRFRGTDRLTVLALLYLYPVAAAAATFRPSLPDVAGRLVVVEGDGRRLRKPLTGDRYEIKGDVEEVQ